VTPSLPDGKKGPRVEEAEHAPCIGRLGSLLNLKNSCDLGISPSRVAYWRASAIRCSQAVRGRDGSEVRALVGCHPLCGRKVENRPVRAAKTPSFKPAQTISGIGPARFGRVACSAPAPQDASAPG
jgi:hypothetical protein